MSRAVLDILGSLGRARELLADLGRSRLRTDTEQVIAGVTHELEAMERILTDLAGVASGDREGKVRGDAPEASRATARRIVLRSGTQRSEVLALLHDYRAGLTDFEIQQGLNMLPSSERPRRGELVDAGLVEVAFQDGVGAATREHNGSDWRVWRITPAGVLAWGTIGAGQQIVFDFG